MWHVKFLGEILMALLIAPILEVKKLFYCGVSLLHILNLDLHCACSYIQLLDNSKKNTCRGLHVFALLISHLFSSSRWNLCLGPKSQVQVSQLLAFLFMNMTGFLQYYMCSYPPPPHTHTHTHTLFLWLSGANHESSSFFLTP